MTTTLNPNGRMRKSLGSQIDRLDDVLDGLADNLNDAVAAAVKEAVGASIQETVSTVLTEVLTNPKFLGALRNQIQTKEAKPKITWRQRLAPATALATRVIDSVRKVSASCWNWLCGTANSAVQGVYNLAAGCVRKTGRAVKSALRFCALLVPFKLQFLAAAMIGVALGTASFFAHPMIAAALSGVGAFSMALALQIGVWVRNLFRRNETLVI